MITPRFTLSQDDTFLTLNIRAPYCSLKDVEIYVENNDFRFICSPYYLRLNLTGGIIQNDASTGEYLSDTGEFLLKYQKLNKGEHFDGLDFVTSLLTAPRKGNKAPNIEVLASESSETDGNEWSIEQNIPDERLHTFTNTYGFASQKTDILRQTEDEYYSVFDIRNADTLSQIERKNLRFDNESMDFSPDHYIADLFDDAQITTINRFENPWKQLATSTIRFNDHEKDLLKDFPNKEYLLNDSDVNNILFGLIDILFAYSYDKRVNEFEDNCESGWTITKISATLSWFDVFSTEKEAIVSAFQRSLIYPLYRNFSLCHTVLTDLRLIFDLGPVFIVKCLLDIYDIFNSSPDPRYILNELYVKDYIIFMQKCPKLKLDQLVANLAEVQIHKSDIRFDLDGIAHGNSTSSETLLEKMAKLKLAPVAEDSDSGTSDDESSSSSDDSSSEYETE